MKPGKIFAVEGVIGVGKTTLARAPAEKLGGTLHLEEHIKNPFLPSFYKDPRRWALACQLSFLEGRITHLRSVSRKGSTPLIFDYIFEKDRLFAAANLQNEEWDLYRRLAAHLTTGEFLRPEVIIWLKASRDEVIRRIRSRPAAVETPMDGKFLESYLEALVLGYEELFPSLRDIPVVVVSTDSEFIAKDPAALDRLIQACQHAPKGLSYCNPMG